MFALLLFLTAIVPLWGAPWKAATEALEDLPEACSFARRLLISAPEDDSSSRFTSKAYAYFYGAPEAQKVPLVVGFTTGDLPDYGEKTGAKVKITVSSGIDFSDFQVSDVFDARGLPDITYVESSEVELELLMERGGLQAGSDYELALLALTGSAGNTLGTVTISWYTFDVDGETWIQQERSVQNDGAGFEGAPNPDAHLVGATLATLAGDGLAGTELLGAWSPPSASGMVTLLLDIYLSPVVDGVLSIMPGPPSLWNFAALNTSIVDGMPCPDGGVGGVEGLAPGVRPPPGAAYCFLRSRGAPGRVNSVDVHLVAADLSGGASMKLFLPAPPAGTFGPFFVAFRELAASPGYAVLSVDIVHAARVQRLGPRPEASINSISTNLPGIASEIQLSFRPGATVAYLTNSRIELRIDESVFRIEDYGCALGRDARPYGAVVRAEVNDQNMCVVTWASSLEDGTGTIEVSDTGEVTGTDVDFDSPSLVGLADEGSAEGSAFHYLLAASGERFAVQRRTFSSTSGDTTIEVIVAASGSLVGVGTSFSTGSFDERLEVGDYIVVSDRTFVIIGVNSDTSCDVTEDGVTPATGVSATSDYLVRWKSRLRVIGAFGETTGLELAAGTSFSIELAQEGAAFWDRTYELTISGTNADSGGLTTRPEIRIYSGRDDDSDGEADYWAAPFAGDPYRLGSVPQLLHVELHPTTVAASATARVLLSFTTSDSSHFTGGQHENLDQGMLLRVYTEHPNDLRLHMADGRDFTIPTSESSAIDCSRWFLELWQEGDEPVPHPSHCWWDAWAQSPPCIYARFAPGSGLRARTHYELAILATLEWTANDITDLISIELTDGDGATVLSQGTGGLEESVTLVRQPIAGDDDEPTIAAIELISVDPLEPEAPLKVTLHSVPDEKHYIVRNSVVRLFLFPLTAWDVGDFCEVTRTDGAIVECAVERRGGHANVITMTLDQNSPAIDGASTVVFEISGLTLPPGGFFRGELGAEVWYHRRETTHYMASFARSAEGRLAAMNFVSVPVASGAGRVLANSASFVREPENVVVLAYAPAATCSSPVPGPVASGAAVDGGPAVPCRLEVVAPSGFRVLSAGTPGDDVILPTGYTVAPLAESAPVCDVRLRSCMLEMAGGSALWAGASYAFTVTVANPAEPLGSNDPHNIWTVQLTGANGWALGRREAAASVALDAGSSFAVQGHLTSAVVQPDFLVCGAVSTLHVHFVAWQRVPSGGTVQLSAPEGYSFEVAGSVECHPEGLVNWPALAACAASGPTAAATLGAALGGGGSFHAFAVKVLLPPAGADLGHFSIETISLASALDAATEVSWSAQLSITGGALFDEALGCCAQGVPGASVQVASMLPASETQASTLVTIRFHWNDLDIDESPLDVRVYAPAGYGWDLGDSGGSLDASGEGGVPTPVVLNPHHTHGAEIDGANVLYLLTTASLRRRTAYSFKAPIFVPESTPGSAANPDSGNSWYVVFGENSAVGGGCRAGGVLAWREAEDAAQRELRAVASFEVDPRVLAWSEAEDAAQGEVRAVASFEVFLSATASSSLASLTASFATATALPAGGAVVLELPDGFAFGSFLGESCTADPSRSQLNAGGSGELPSDASLACEDATASSAAAFVWTVGATGLLPGPYSATVFVELSPSLGSAGVTGEFRLATFTDTARTTVGDAAAAAALRAPALRLPQAELAMAHMDAASGLVDRHAGNTTWVALAFELAVSTAPDVELVVRAPLGFEVPRDCEVHVGDGNLFTPLGVNAQSLPEPLTEKYVLFPPSMQVGCVGRGREAHIYVAPSTFGGELTALPAVAGKLYLFRLRVVNPATTPVLNEWFLRVADQEYSGIPGFSLMEFKATSLLPRSTAAGDPHLVRVQFWSRTPIPGTFGSRHGVVVIDMPSGFKLRHDAAFLCIGFTGVQNSSGPVGAAVTCEADPLHAQRVILHNNLEHALGADRYELDFEVTNPELPMAATSWTIRSYSSATIRDVEVLDEGSLEGFRVNARLYSFEVEPRPSGQQNSGVAVSLRFALMLSSAAVAGDALIVHAPSEYEFDCSGSGFQSPLLPRPTCSGSRVAFSLAADGASNVPVILPASLEGATVVTFDLATTNPSAKPVRNVLEFAHCRGITANSPLLGEEVCPPGTETVQSLQRRLWPIVPRIADVRVALAAQHAAGFTVSAQNRSSNVRLKFRLTSAGATTLRVECPGMNFASCRAEIKGVVGTCTGGVGFATIAPPAGMSLIAAGEGAGEEGLTDVLVTSVVNPLTPGRTTWQLTTFGLDPDAPDAGPAIFDQSDLIESYEISRFLPVEPVRECTPQHLLREEVQETWHEECTAKTPWYGQYTSQVVLRFGGIPGGESMEGHWLLIQPPQGFTFSAASPAEPHEGPDWLPGTLPGTLKPLEQGVRDFADLSAGPELPGLSGNVLLIKLDTGVPMLDPFSVMVSLDNPLMDPEVNMWRMMLLSPDFSPLYTNDGNWPGFSLRGSFLDEGGRTTVESLVSAFPGEANVVRLSISLGSPLVGSHLQVRVAAPEGFHFESDCLPDNPDLFPLATSTQPGWVTSCTHDVTNRNIARLSIPNIGTGGGRLEMESMYSVNLLVKNSETFKIEDSPRWEIYTFRDNELSYFVHYTALPSFPLEVLWARLAPESRRFGASSLLFVSLRPMRDLGPHGQVVIHAPRGFQLFCALRPFFVRGNLPNGVSCAGANNFAVLQLSGGDFLEQGVAYQFAVRVSNPLVDTLGYWGIRLQTKDRELVHETSQVPGFLLVPQAISRFVAAPVSHVAGQKTWIRVHFKLETQLARASVNVLELTAPTDVAFGCAASLAREGYVLPSLAVRLANLPQFADLLKFLEPPAAKGLQAYRNDGTTEDGRAIVDCSRTGVVRLVVDYTDHRLSSGRYAFMVEVENPARTPDQNVWTLQSFADGSLVEEGAAGGYEVAVYATDSSKTFSSPAAPVVTSSALPRCWLSWPGPLVALVAVSVLLG